MLGVIRQLALGRSEVGLGGLPVVLALGHHAQHHRRLAGDELVVGGLDLIRRHFADGVQALEHIVGILGEHLPHGELAHLAGDAVQTPDGRGTIAVDRLLQILRLEATTGELADHLVHLALEGLQAAIHRRIGIGVDGEGTGQLLTVVGGPRIDRLAALDQRLVEHGAGGAAQHVGKHVEGRLLRIAERHGRVADVEQRQVHLVLERHVTGLGQGHRLGGRLGHLGSTRDRAEVLLNPGQRLLGVEVAAQGQGGVVGAVPAQEELLEVVDVDPVEILHIADGLPGVGMGARVERLAHLLAHQTVRLVVDALGPFVLDGGALDLELLLAHRIEQEAHAVGLQPQHLLQLVGRHGLVVVGAVLVGGAVHVATGLVDDPHVLLIPHVLGALEHHVLEEVGESGLTHLLAGRAHVIGDVQVHQGIGSVGRQNDGQAVVQLVHLIGNAELALFLDLFRHQGGCRQHGQREAQKHA